MLANRTGRWSLGAALLCLVILAATWFLLISPRKAEASDLQDQVLSAQSQASQLQIQIAELKSQYADLPKRKAELAAIKKQLPPRADIPAYVRQLQSIAEQSGLHLDSIVAGTPVVVSGATTPGVAAVAGPGSVVSVPITLVVTGEYFEASLFVKYLQTKIVRSYLVTGLSAIPAPEPDVAPATVAPAPSATGTAAPVTPAVTATAAAKTPTLERTSLTLAGSVFVLMDGTTTLKDIKDEAAAAAGGKTVTPTAAPATGTGGGTTTTS